MLYKNIPDFLFSPLPPEPLGPCESPLCVLECLNSMPTFPSNFFILLRSGAGKCFSTKDCNTPLKNNIRFKREPY